MTDYSYSDLVKMQDQAIRRVREMQERARLTVRENPIPELKSVPSAEETFRDDNTRRTENESENKVESKPEAPKTGKKEQPKKPPTHDRDKAILLPLIMLLSQEGADNILMIALLYILA